MKNPNFYFNNGELYFTYRGETGPFDECPLSLIDKLGADLDANQQAQQKLDLAGIHKSVARLRAYASLKAGISPVEFQAVNMLARGLTSHQAASRIFISDIALRKRIVSIKQKLGIKTHFALGVYTAKTLKL